MASSLYRELTDSQLNTIVSETFDTEIISAHLLTGGLFNTTYLVDIEKYGKTVLRVGPINRQLLMPFEHNLMQAEEYVYSLCEGRGISTSKVLAVDTSKTLIDRDFIFVQYIPSRPMSEVELNSQDKENIYYEIGQSVAKMHDISAQRFGRVADVKQGGGFELWSSAILNELREWEKVGVPTHIFTQDEHAKINLLFEKSIPYLDEIKKPSLVHADLWAGNILIDNKADNMKFVAIIDADRAIFGDKYFEFSSIQWTYGEKSFWNGYGSKLPNSREDVIRRKIYTLLNRLWNAYVYLIEYNQPDKCAVEAQDARAQIAELEKLR